MKTLNEFLSAYGESHQNPTNQIIHKICVPIITFTVIGILWSIPRPDFFSMIAGLNWGTLFVLACLIFYSFLSSKMFIGMLIKTSIMCFICHILYIQGSLLSVSIFLFIISWIFQFWGHKIEGKKPSFLNDLLFLLIGPLWVLKSLYQKLGIKVS